MPRQLLQAGTAFLVLAPIVLAQQLSISGTVRDNAAAVIPGVEVTLREPGGSTSQTSTGQLGQYRFSITQPGSYELSFARTGFQNASQTVSIETTPKVVDVTLGLAPLASTLTVTDTMLGATASRLDIPDRDIPAQVSTISQEILRQQNTNDLITALRNASGVSAANRYGMYESYTVRGFSTTSDFGLLMDGFRSGGARANTQLTNIERVEVLKGPSSILYGEQPFTGGSINIIRKQPRPARTYDLLYRGGRFNTHQVAGGATGKLFGSERLFYRLDSGYSNSAGWRSVGSERFNLSPSATWSFGDRGSLTLHETFNRDHFETDGGVPITVLTIPGFNPKTRFDGPQNFDKIHESQTEALLNLRLTTNLQFRNQFFYRLVDDQYYSVQNYTHVPALNEVTRRTYYYDAHRRPIQNRSEILARFDFAGMPHVFLAGFEYSDNYNYLDQSPRSGAALPPVNLATFQETIVPFPDFPIFRVDYQTNRSKAVYWQDQISVTRRFKINVGGRYDKFLRLTRSDPWANGQAVSRGVEDRRRQDPYTYRAGAVFSATEAQEIYVSSASSFQSVVQIPADGSQLEPETGRSFEVGHRWRGAGGRFNISTALYRIERQNVVISLGAGRFEQAGQQSSKGVDIDIDGRLPGGVSMIANYGYTLPRYDRYISGAFNLAGFRPRYTQLHTVNLWLTKAWKSGISASAGARYLSPMYGDNENFYRLGGSTIFNGAFSYRWRRYEWSINAENLLNRQRYFNWGINGTQVYPGAPINVFTTMRFDFR